MASLQVLNSNRIAGTSLGEEEKQEIRFCGHGVVRAIWSGPRKTDRSVGISFALQVSSSSKRQIYINIPSFTDGQCVLRVTLNWDTDLRFISSTKRSALIKGYNWTGVETFRNGGRREHDRIVSSYLHRIQSERQGINLRQDPCRHPPASAESRGNKVEECGGRRMGKLRVFETQMNGHEKGVLEKVNTCRSRS